MVFRLIGLFSLGFSSLVLGSPPKQKLVVFSPQNICATTLARLTTTKAKPERALTVTGEFLHHLQDQGQLGNSNPQAVLSSTQNLVGLMEKWKTLDGNHKIHVEWAPAGFQTLSRLRQAIDQVTAPPDLQSGTATSFFGENAIRSYFYHLETQCSSLAFSSERMVSWAPNYFPRRLNKEPAPKSNDPTNYYGYTGLGCLVGLGTVLAGGLSALFIPADDFTTTLGVFTLPVISSFAVRALMFRPIPVLTSNYAWHAFQAKVQEALRSGDNAQYHLGLNVEEGLFIDFFFQQKDKEPVLATLIWGKNFPKQKEATKAPEQLRLFDDQPTQTVRQTELPFGNRDSRGLPMDASLESTEEPFSYRGGLSWPFPT